MFFFFKQKTAYDMLRGLVGSEMCIRDRLVVGLLSIPSKIEIMPYMWGIALILAGIYLAWNALRPAK